MVKRVGRKILCERLADALRDHFQLLEVSGPLGDLWASEDAAFICSPELLVSQHFAYQPDLLIFDPRGGTLGTVMILPKLSAKSLSEHAEVSLNEQAQEAVEQAAYLCHLLLAAAQSVLDRGQAVRAPAVELVLVLEEGHERDCDAVGDALRRLARESDLLYALGVGLLYRRQGEELLSDGPLRRAFPWLLRATSRWLRAEDLKMREENASPQRYPRLSAEAKEQLGFNSNSTIMKNAIAFFKSKGDEKGPFAIRTDLLHLDELHLDCYRLPDSVYLKLTSGSRTHLIHGHNGTGKSALAESIELLLTGRVDRIERQLRHRIPTEDPNGPVARARRAELYNSVIRPRQANGHAHVTFHVRTVFEAQERKATIDAQGGSSKSESGPTLWLDSEQAPVGLPWELSSDELTDPFCDPVLPSASFRLDQKVMDELAQSSDTRRAAIFLEAFFPEEEHLYGCVARAQRGAQEALSVLERQLTPAPESLPEDAAAKLEVLGQALIDRFAWLRAGASAEPTEEQLKQCLPLLLEHLNGLAHIEPDVRPALDKWQQSGLESLPETLTQIDLALEKILDRLPTILAALHSAEECLQSLANWYVVDESPPIVDFRRVFDQWLEACALADLADRRHGLILTQRRAADLGWQPTGDRKAAFLPELVPEPAEASMAERERDQWRVRRDKLFDQVQRARERRRQTTSKAKVDGSEPTAPLLTLSQIAALNQVGPWIDAASESGGFGDLCRDAVEGPRHIAVGTVTVGDEGWTEKPLHRVRTLLTACKALSDCQELSKAGIRLTWSSGRSRLERIRTALERYGELVDLETEMQKTFLSKITAVPGSDRRDSRLDDALNELLALFTPTRWAYRDLQLTHRDDGAGPCLGMGEDGDEGRNADLRLNTAELNLFTLALFLLCAPRLSNPFQLLILDDPLQNMDELTVTTLARGLARLEAVLPEGWRLLMLFHGEDDLDRFRHQLPEAAIYRLPWLRPLHDGHGGKRLPIEIRAEDAPKIVGPLDLGQVIHNT